MFVIVDIYLDLPRYKWLIRYIWQKLTFSEEEKELNWVDLTISKIWPTIHELGPVW